MFFNSSIFFVKINPQNKFTINNSGKIKAQKEQVTKYSNLTSKTKVTMVIEIHKKQNSQTI